MRRHLAYFRRYRRVLRLRVNAREARLVDGAEEPTHRGACKHLLGKLDRGAITAALARRPLVDDPAARAEFLAGAARVSTDVGVLLDYLETLRTVRTHAARVRAFADAVERIDFAGLSAARTKRLLTLMHDVHGEEELVHVLFGLLANDSFRSTFDQHAGELDPEVVARFAPLRAVYRALRGRSPVKLERPALEKGLRELLTGSADALDAHRRSTRERLATVALELGAAWAVDCAGVFRVLKDAPPEGPVALRVGRLRAFQLVQLRREDEALSSLETLHAAHPDDSEIAELLTWLRRPRLGRLAVSSATAAPLRRAFHLTRLTPVLARVAPVEQFATAAELHASACLPGVAPVLDSGGEGELTWVAIPPGPTLAEALAAKKRNLEMGLALLVATDGVRVFRALALAGIFLPDADPARFLLDLSGDQPHLVLADLCGATAAEPNASAQAMVPVAVAWCRTALAWPPFRGGHLRREVPDALTDSLDNATDLASLVATLVEIG
jgi:hypothetical protein